MFFNLSSIPEESDFCMDLIENSFKEPTIITLNGVRYWIGTYGCLVSENNTTCRAKDGFNKVYKNGKMTDTIVIGKYPTMKEWFDKYTYQYGKYRIYKISY